MVALASLLVVVMVSMVVTRVASVALRATGLSADVARFQARSAFSGVGFTTSESEAVVSHPVRRKIIMWLVVLGNAGIVTTVASLMLTFAGADGGQATRRVALLAAGVVALRVVASSRAVDRVLTSLTERALRRYTDVDLNDYASLLQVGGPYTVARVTAEDGDWVTGRRLDELRLRDEGVIVLGVYRRRGGYVGVPTGSTVVERGDRLLVYGCDDDVAELSARRAGDAGDRAHRDAVERHRDVLTETTAR